MEMSTEINVMRESAYLALWKFADETVTSLSVEASRKALEMANVKPEEVDLLLLCTSTPDDLFGSAPQVYEFKEAD